MRFSSTAKMARKSCISMTSKFLLVFLFLACDPLNAIALKRDDVFSPHRLITREKRRTLASTDSGQISAVVVDDGYRGPYHLQFITMEPSSLFLPVMLQTDMVFYVDSGRGQLTYHDGEDKRDQVELEHGDIFRLRCGSVFYVQSYANPMREKLRIFAIFTRKISENIQLEYFGAYSKISDLVLGFNERVLQIAFKVSEEEMEGITMAEKPPSIVHMSKNTENDKFDWRDGIIQALVGGGSLHSLDNKKGKTFNILKAKPDFKNCNGWSLAVTSKDFHALKGSDVGAFMVNLNKGSMMGPHWNPRATEIAVVLQGQGMIRVVCPSDAPQCKNARFRVKEGDVFAVPRFHPMAQISFNNDSLVFMGFSTMARINRPQFLAGKWSVLRTIDEDILAMSFNVSNTTIKHFISAQSESVILECASCAEYEEKKMEEDIEKEKQEEKGRQREEEEEEARKKQEEEEREKEQEEEEREKEQKEREKEQEREEREKEQEQKEREKEQEEEKREKEQEQKEREKEQEQQEQKEREKEQKEREKEQEQKEREKEQEEEEREKEQEQKEREKEQEQQEQKEREKEQKEREKEQEQKEREKEQKEREKEQEQKEREKEQEEARRQKEEREARQKEEKEARKREEEEETKRREKEWEEEEGRREEKRQEEKKREKEWEEPPPRKEEEKKEEGKGGGGGGGWKSLKSVF